MTQIRRVSIFFLALVFSLSLAAGAFAAAEQQEQAIKSRVDEIVKAINGGKQAKEFEAEAKAEPYVFIMEENGNMLVHPTLANQNLKQSAEPVYTSLLKATPQGTWVDYEWQGKQKRTYVRKTDNNLIVGSGYNK